MAGRERRGFAAMSPEKQREIARRGGRAAHEKGTAHEFSRDEARAAGRTGGVAVSRDREHMSRIGRAGGLSSRGGRRPELARSEMRSDSAESQAAASPAS